MIRPIFSAFFAIATLFVGFGHAAASDPDFRCNPDQVLIYGASDAPVRIDVELATTPAQRAQGLMYRDALAAGTGMLFIYEVPQPVAFWMRNTRIPLDMLFIDETGVIRHIHENAIPFDETPIPGNLPEDTNANRLMVLEIAGGQAQEMMLVSGMQIAHPALPQSVALRPCN